MKKSIYRRLRYAAMLRAFAKKDVDQIDAFRKHMLSFRRLENDRLARVAHGFDEDDPYLESLADDAWQVEQSIELAEELCIVALYRIIEHKTGHVLRMRFPDENVPWQWDKLGPWLRKRGIEHQGVPHYRAANEIRLLNNAIKHTGAVSAPLAENFKRWKLREPLGNLDAAYLRLAPLAPRYLERLAQRVGAEFP